MRVNWRGVKGGVYWVGDGEFFIREAGGGLGLEVIFVCGFGHGLRRGIG